MDNDPEVFRVQSKPEPNVGHPGQILEQPAGFPAGSDALLPRVRLPGPDHLLEVQQILGHQLLRHHSLLPPQRRYRQ